MGISGKTFPENSRASQLCHCGFFVTVNILIVILGNGARKKMCKFLKKRATKSDQYFVPYDLRLVFLGKS